MEGLISDSPAHSFEAKSPSIYERLADRGVYIVRL